MAQASVRIDDLTGFLLIKTCIDPENVVYTRPGRNYAIRSQETVSRYIQRIQTHLVTSARAAASKELSEDSSPPGACFDCARPLSAYWYKGKIRCDPSYVWHNWN